MIYNIISTGSKGNAVVVDNILLIDCGVSYKQVEPFASGLKLVLLTHIHGDHFYPMTIKKLAKERPTLRFGCCKWLVKPLIQLGVQKWRIDVYTPKTLNRYSSTLAIEAVELTHDVQNCGYKIYINNSKIFYATDTANLRGITALDFDLYMIEANFDEQEIKERIENKQKNGEFVYEFRVLKTHLSKQKCDAFIAKNAGKKSKFVYMHGHISKGG